MNNYTNKQKEIIFAAIELIAEKGIQQLTIKNLSKKIGVVEGAIYRHFDSKINILLGILKIFKENKDNTLNRINQIENKPHEQLQQLFIERFSQFTKYPAIAAVIFSEEIFQNEKRLSDEVYNIMKESQQVIRKILENGQQSSLFRMDISAEQLSLLITGALRLIVTQWRLSGFAFDLEAEGQKLWQSINKIVTK